MIDEVLSCFLFGIKQSLVIKCGLLTEGRMCEVCRFQCSAVERIPFLYQFVFDGSDLWQLPDGTNYRLQQVGEQILSCLVFVWFFLFVFC